MQMLDEKDLQAIEKLIDANLSQQKGAIAGEVNLIIENQVTQRLNLLEEGQQSILEKLVPRSRVDDLEEEVRSLKSMMRQISEDVQALKKAN